MIPHSRRMPPAYRQFLLILAFTVVMIIALNAFGPLSDIHVPPPYVIQRTYLTSDCQDGRRLGNLMFNYASMVGIAGMHNMTIVMREDFRLFGIFQVSALKSDHMENTLGVYQDYEEYGRRASAFDRNVENIKNMNTRLHGYFQSWKYFNKSINTVKHEFRFKKDIDDAAKTFILKALNDKNLVQSSVTLIGIHVRRGDYLQPHYSQYGYSTAPADYFLKARKYFTDNFSSVLFIVCSDDIQWCKNNIQGDNVFYSETGSDVTDLAILSHCNHTIMSTGSFGWWGAFLAGGRAVYYDKWPRPVSILEYMVTKTDFFMPQWIPMV